MARTLKSNQRLKEKIVNTESKTAGHSPPGIVKQMIGVQNVSKEIEENLLFGEVLKSQIKSSCNSIPCHKMKQLVRRVIVGKVIKNISVLRNV